MQSFLYGRMMIKKMVTKDKIENTEKKEINRQRVSEMIKDRSGRILSCL